LESSAASTREYGCQRGEPYSFLPACLTRIARWCRYLIILTPRLAQLITELHSLVDPSQLTETLAKYETSLVERRNPRSGR
jgi:hypothetical protein